MKNPYEVSVDTRGATAFYPMALNTPLDQIPLTLQEAETLMFQLDCAIKEATGYGELTE